MNDINDLANDIAYAITHMEREKREFRMKVIELILDKVSEPGYTPVDTGNLRDSWSTIIDYKRDNSLLYNNVEYAPDVEYGHRAGKRFVEGKYMLRNALRDTEGVIEGEYDQFIERLLRRD